MRKSKNQSKKKTKVTYSRVLLRECEMVDLLIGNIILGDNYI